MARHVKRRAAVREGLSAYADGLEAEMRDRPAIPPERFRAPRLRQMWAHGWNAGIEVEFRMRPAARVARAAAAA